MLRKLFKIVFVLFYCYPSTFESVVFETKESATSKLSPLVPSEDYTHKYIADEDNPNNYVLFCKFLNDDEILFEIHCKTLGWVALGISLNGGMEGADIAIGWVDANGKGYLKDTYTKSFSIPLIDQKQDLTLLDSAEKDGYTIIKYKRKLITCDKNEDVDIKSETNYLIYAWHKEDPITGNNDWKKHEINNRFNRVTMLFDYISDNVIVDIPNLASDNRTVVINNVKIPTKRTFYFCEMFEVAPFDKEVHLIGYELLLNRTNRGLVHHLIVFQCDDDFSMVPGEPTGYECGPVKMPEYISKKCRSKALTSWGIGGPTTMFFPNDTGYLYKKSNKSTIILLEMHYDNVNGSNGRYDSTGIRLHYTSKLRERELGVFVNGLGIGGFPMHSLNIQIPAKTEKIKVTSICYTGCTNKYFPEEGITALSGFLHTHLAGLSIKTQLVRNGKVVKDLFHNPRYNPDYQYNIDIPRTKIYRGDALFAECIYNTNDRDTFTHWGYGTLEEMCTNMIYYYPRIDNFDFCYSTNSIKELFGFYRNLMKDNLIPYMELNETAIDSNTEYSIIEMLEKVGTNEALRSRFKAFVEGTPNQTAYCGNSAGQTYFDEPFLKKQDSIIEITDSCQNNDSIEISKFNCFSIFIPFITFMFTKYI